MQQGQPDGTEIVFVLRDYFARLGLEAWPMAEQQPVGERAVAETTVSLSRWLGLDALFRLFLAPLLLDGQLRHLYQVEQPALVVSWCDLASPQSSPVKRLRALASEAVLLLAPNSPNALDAENSAFRIACTLTKVRSLCGGEERSGSLTLISMASLPFVVQAAVLDVAGRSETSVSLQCHALLHHLESLFQPGNHASLMNFLGFRALLHLSAAVPGREELLEARMEEITGRAQYRWPRALVCLRLTEALMPELFLYDYYARYFNDSSISAVRDVDALWVMVL
ncbi:uncharacterized protein LOC144120348 [Amblyomma americanum]